MISLLAYSCGNSKYLISTEIYAPGENGLNFYKMTDDKDNVFSGYFSMDVNPVTNEIAFVSARDDANNVFIKEMNNSMTSKQRTFRRNVKGVTYSNDGKQILFQEFMANDVSTLFLTDAYTGGICHQLTEGWRGEFTPNDSTIIFDKSEIVGYSTQYNSGGCFSAGSSYNVPKFERSLWGYNIYNAQLFTVCKGRSVTMIPSEPNSMYCIRNDKEIWKVNMATGSESIIYSHPLDLFTLELSPDENWIAFVGESEVNKRKNKDIYMIKTDGSNPVQITYHEAGDLCPKWIDGGKNLLLISDRGNTDEKYNIWKIANPLYNYR